MGVHALLSASSSHRWLHCTPSARLEETFHEQTSVFAEEGTAAHALSEHKLRLYMGQTSTRPTSSFDSPDLEYYTDLYVEFATELIESAKRRCKDPIILFEQRLDYSNYVQDGFGTGDLVIIADGLLEIVDLKYGKGVVVEAERNPQMKLYALGACHLFDNLYDIEQIRMIICQPRLEAISTYELTKEELLCWAQQDLQPKAKLAWEGAGDYVPGDHCRFCKARHVCRARADSFVALTRHDCKPAPLLTRDEMAEVLTMADKLSQWATEVYAYATQMAMEEGIEWPGFKLVEGRSYRKYTSEADVIDVLHAAGISDIYKQTLLGISDMEKRLGKTRFVELLSAWVDKPEGKPTLVPLSDKRPPMTHYQTATADFKEE